MRVSSSLSQGLLAGLFAGIPMTSGCLLDYYVGDFDTGRPPAPNTPIDLDGDGFTSAQGDCDDNDPLRSPGQPEVCDGRDEDCDGLIDQDGTSTHRCDRSESFPQSMRADVLVVIDISPSMEPYTMLAGDGALAMLEPIVGKGHETHVGVITTDMETDLGDGRLVEANIPSLGVRRYLNGTESYADASVWLKLAITNHTYAADIKEGVKDAIASSITEHSDGWNSGFYRSDADLAIVVFSDDADPSEMDNATFLTQLQSYVGQLGDTTRLYTIAPYGPPDTGTPTDCETLPPASDLLLLASDSNGMTHNLCTLDYEGFLSGVGQDIANKSLADEVTLQNPAIPSSISISLSEGGSEPYPWVGGITISPDGRTIHFEPAPPAGTDIIVDYRIAP